MDGNAYQSRDVFLEHDVTPRNDGGPGVKFVSIATPAGAAGQGDLMAAVSSAGPLAGSSLTWLGPSQASPQAVGS